VLTPSVHVVKSIRSTTDYLIVCDEWSKITIYNKREEKIKTIASPYSM
jgi:hypothetical protein